MNGPPRFPSCRYRPRGSSNGVSFNSHPDTGGRVRASITSSATSAPSCSGAGLETSAGAAGDGEFAGDGDFAGGDDGFEGPAIAAVSSFEFRIPRGSQNNSRPNPIVDGGEGERKGERKRKGEKGFNLPPAEAGHAGSGGDGPSREKRQRRCNARARVHVHLLASQSVGQDSRGIRGPTLRSHGPAHGRRT